MRPFNGSTGFTWNLPGLFPLVWRLMHFQVPTRQHSIDNEACTSAVQSQTSRGPPVESDGGCQAAAVVVLTYSFCWCANSLMLPEDDLHTSIFLPVCADWDILMVEGDQQLADRLTSNKVLGLIPEVVPKNMTARWVTVAQDKPSIFHCSVCCISTKSKSLFVTHTVRHVWRVVQRLGCCSDQ